MDSHPAVPSKAAGVKVDVASMSAARNPSRTAPATKFRDGFHLIPNDRIVFSSGAQFVDITYDVSEDDACARIAINRPHILNAFRPTTILEVQKALTMATDDPRVGVILLTSHVDRDRYTPAFCAGGDQTARSHKGGYQDESDQHFSGKIIPKLRVLDLQVQMRRCPKPIIAVVQGYAVGGGHILHMLSDLTICSEDAVFGQTGPRMGSVDAGYGSTHMARLIGQKKAREFWFLCRFYSAHEALQMGLVNCVVPSSQLWEEVAKWVRRINMNSPTAIACAKAAINADEEGAEGISQMGAQITRLFYQSEEGQEGRHAFLEKRAPDFKSFL